MTINIHTLLLIGVVTYALFGILQLAVWLMRRSDTALAMWALANVVGGCGALLMVLRDQIPDWASIAFGNSLIILGWMLLAEGLRRFANRPLRSAWLFMLSLVIFGLFEFVPSIGGNPVARIQLAIVIYMVISLVIVYECWRAEQRERLIMRRLLMALFGLSIAAASARLICITGIDSGVDSTSYPFFHPAGILFGGFMLVACNLIVVLMANERFGNRLEYNAYHDALTNVLNRAGFLDLATRQIKRSVRDQSVVSVLVMDLDRFKLINDQHGHFTGDRILCAFANVVRKNIRPADLLTRYGGEEFCLLLPGITAAGAAALAERVRIAFSQMLLPVKDALISATVSIGVAEIQLLGESLAEALARADKALYQAKLQGRNRVCFASVATPVVNYDLLGQ